MTRPSILKQGRWTPWFYLVPALFLILVFIVYPTANSVRLSFLDRAGENSAATECQPGAACWGWLENYRYALTSPAMLRALGNNALWLLVMVPATVAFGLLAAVLADKVPYEGLMKSLIFMPMAISFIGAGVIWRFVFAVESGGGQQIGLLNGVLVGLGAAPVAWLTRPIVNNLALMTVGVWLWAGFCMTILSAALKALPVEVLEASRVDGASEWQLFWRVMMPMILPTITVVTTTMFIIVLKIFDIVFVMTGGNFGTEVIANRMFNLIVTHTGRSTAIAVLLLLLTVPVMLYNMRRFQQEEAER